MSIFAKLIKAPRGPRPRGCHVLVVVEEDTSPAFVDPLSQTMNQVILSPTSEDDCLNSLVSNVNNVDILDKEFELSDFVYVTKLGSCYVNNRQIAN